MRVPIPNSEEYLLLRELTHRMNNEFASAAYCRRWLGLASILRRRAIASFAIFDTFDDEAGRDAHLNGKVAAALMEKAKAGDLFAKTPEIHKLGILADKLPK